MGLVLGHRDTQVSFAKISIRSVTSVRAVSTNRSATSVRPRTSGRDLGEVPSAVADQELKARGVVAEVHQEVADLLGGPRPVRVRGHAEDVHVAGADLDHEEAVQAPEGHRAVDVEEVGSEHRRGLRVRELPPRGVGVPLGRRGIFSALRTRRIEDAPPWWPSFNNSPWILLYPQPWFSVASRSISAAISVLTGGRPVRFG